MTAEPRDLLPDLLCEAARALAAHRLRATLSIVGIVFGVATVVTALAIGQGARDAAIADIGSLGVENVFVRSAVPKAADRKAAPAPILTEDDARALAGAVPGVAAWATSRTWRGDAAGPRGSHATVLAGVSPSWRAIGRPTLAAGRWLSDADARERRRVGVVGGGLARALFGGADPIGQRVAIGGVWFVVVGRLAERESRATVQRVVADQSFFVPIGAMDVSVGDGDRLDRVEEIALAFADAAAAERAAPVIRAVLTRRQVDPARAEVVVPRELLNARLRAQRTFNAVLVAIGALALAISGIGIMNIMLASVAERTQEIGVRRAFGARRREVVVQFAMEAALLCVAGGAAGVPLGWILSAIVAAFAGWPTTMTAASIALALALAVGVGLVFGVYPARVAASVDPAEALRAP